MTNLERAYLDGARDDKTVKALGQIYVKEGRWADAALLYEGAAEDPLARVEEQDMVPKTRMC